MIIDREPSNEILSFFHFKISNGFYSGDGHGDGCGDGRGAGKPERKSTSEPAGSTTSVAFTPCPPFPSRPTIIGIPLLAESGARYKGEKEAL